MRFKLVQVLISPIISIICVYSSGSLASEPRIKIAVIDTGVDLKKTNLLPYVCSEGNISFVKGKALEDSIGHGTNVIGLIADKIDPVRFCILVLKTCGEDLQIVNNTNKAIAYAIKQNVKYINMSFNGNIPDETEFKLIKLALSKGIKIAVAAGNEGKDLDRKCDSFPACYTKYLNSKLFRVVGSNTKFVIGRNYANYGKIVKYKEDGTYVGSPRMTGTSQSTAILMGKWISE